VGAKGKQVKGYLPYWKKAAVRHSKSRGQMGGNSQEKVPVGHVTFIDKYSHLHTSETTQKY